MVALRTEVLRKPLGLVFLEDQLNAEVSDLHIGAFKGSQLVGCCILSPRTYDAIQLRQMAVDPALQLAGIGAAILEFSEDHSIQNGFQKLILHARKNALGFYQKSGYEIVGDEFAELGIPHYQMEKVLIRR